MPGPFDYLANGDYQPPWLSQPPAAPQPPAYLAPEQSGAPVGLGAPEPAQPEPPAYLQQSAPEPAPLPIQPGERIKASQSSSGYRPATYKPRDPMGPLVKAEAETRSQTATQAGNIEELGRLEAAREQDVGQFALDEGAKVAAQNEADRLEINTAMETERAGQMARIQQAIDSIPGRDPQRWWKNMSDFQRAAGFMSASIDGYLNPGGVNQTVEQANKLAEADAYAQMSDIETAQKKVGYQASAYERILGDHEFKRQAFTEAKAYRQFSLASAIEQRAMTFKSPITQQKHLVEADKIRAEGQKTLATLAGQQSDALNAAANRALQERMQKSAQAFELAKEDRARAAAAGAAADSNVIMDPSRKDGRAWVIGTNVANKDKLLENLSNPKNGLADLGELAKGMKELYGKSVELGRIYNGPGAKTLARESEALQARADAEALRMQILQKFIHSNYGAVIPPGEQKAILAQVPSIDALTGPEGAKALQTFLQVQGRKAQSHINGLDLRDAKTGERVDLEREWGTIDKPDVATSKPEYLDTPELLDAGNQVAAGLSEIPAAGETDTNRPSSLGRPDDAAQPAPDKSAQAASRSQAKLLEARANELVRRSKSYADRTSMTPEVGAQAVDTLKQWAAQADRAGSTDVAEKIMAKAIELENQITSGGPMVTPEADLGVIPRTPGFQRR